MNLKNGALNKFERKTGLAFSSLLALFILGVGYMPTPGTFHGHLKNEEIVSHHRQTWDDQVKIQISENNGVTQFTVSDNEDNIIDVINLRRKPHDHHLFSSHLEVQMSLLGKDWYEIHPTGTGNRDGEIKRFIGQVYSQVTKQTYQVDIEYSETHLLMVKVSHGEHPIYVLTGNAFERHH